MLKETNDPDTMGGESRKHGASHASPFSQETHCHYMNFKHILPTFMGLTMLAMPQHMDAHSRRATQTYAGTTFKIRVCLADKKGNGYSINHPEKFLSAKAIARRQRYGLKVDQYDLPLTERYVNELRKLGLTEHTRSKWTNSVVMETGDTTVMNVVRKLPFVTDVRCVWIQPQRTSGTEEEDEDSSLPTDRHLIKQATKGDTLAGYYGQAQRQVEMLGVDKLHTAGYTGSGVTIAVIDGGFYNADLIHDLPHEHILSTRNFVRDRSIYDEQSHGMMVLSCIGARRPHALVGTAPDASFHLMVSEDGDSEQLVEEDNWCAAVERADSLGCDMVTSSLGYAEFDHPNMTHTYRELDGHTAINSRVASLAASRGMVLLNSAGNSGWGPWKKIGFPADAKDILAVGAVDSTGLNTPFSSIGNAADNRIKPDVMAMGEKSAVFDVDGQVETANGTSFSCPILCGAVACLIQAYPKLPPTTIMNAVRQAGNNAAHPDNIFGYGIPDMMKAFESLKK